MTETKAVYRVTPDGDAPPETARAPESALDPLLTPSHLATWAALAARVPDGWTVGTSEEGDLLVYIPGTAPLYIGDMAETEAADHDLADFLAIVRLTFLPLLAEVQRLRALLAQTIEALESSIQQVERLLERD